MQNNRLRNLTTGRLHTRMEDIFEDIGWITGIGGWKIHELPNARLALLPWLKEKVTEPRFWDETFDLSYFPPTNLSPMNEAERDAFMARYAALPNPLLKLGKATEP